MQQRQLAPFAMKIFRTQHSTVVILNSAALVHSEWELAPCVEGLLPPDSLHLHWPVLPGMPRARPSGLMAETV